MANKQAFTALAEIEEKQFEIIHKQSGIIDELFQLLLNYVTLDEIEPLTNSMQEVAEMKKEIE